MCANAHRFVQFVLAVVDVHFHHRKLKRYRGSCKLGPMFYGTSLKALKPLSATKATKKDAGAMEVEKRFQRLFLDGGDVWRPSERQLYPDVIPKQGYPCRVETCVDSVLAVLALFTLFLSYKSISRGSNPIAHPLTNGHDQKSVFRTHFPSSSSGDSRGGHHHFCAFGPCGTDRSRRQTTRCSGRGEF